MSVTNEVTTEKDPLSQTDRAPKPFEAGGDTNQRQRALSHRDYLSTLQRPSAAEIRRISDIQLQKEAEVERKYHSTAESEAATAIQKAYRGHRERRQLKNLTLDPSSRWREVIQEWRYRMATAPHHNSLTSLSPEHRARATSDLAKENWSRATLIAERAGAGESWSPTGLSDSTPLSPPQGSESTTTENSMLMDLRYFLEMVDQKHRYGANLQIYHLEWQRCQTTENFFYWLDHGTGKNVSLPYCDRTKLDHERIRYLSKEERKDYLVSVDDKGRLRWEKNGELISTSADLYKDSIHGIVSKEDTETPAFTDDVVKEKLSQDHRFNRKIAAAMNTVAGRFAASDSEDEGSDDYDGQSITSSTTTPTSPREEAMAHQMITKDKTPRKRLHVSPATILNRLLRASIKPGTWIYVCDTVGRLYVGIKNSGSFQHASFLSGARISSAGSIGIEDGRLTFLSPLSGHYRPTTKSFRLFVDNLKEQKVDLSQLKVSQAYSILLGMEYYGKTKEGLRKATHRDKGTRDKDDRKRKSDTEDIAEELGVPATFLVEQHWQKDHHRKALGRLMDNLNIRRRSDEQLREPS